MWAIKNRTPYKAAATWGRDKDGIHEWIVAVKATFSIRPDGQLALADDQLEPLQLPEYHGEPGSSSLRYEADVVAMKPTTDVVLNATAYAPGGRPSTDFPIAIKVGQIQKTLRVRGNRRWFSGPFGVGPTDPEPITQIPIIYERAYGGYDHADSDPQHHRIDLRNPVGCGVLAQSGRRVGPFVPNLEYPNGSPEKMGPAGFGPIDSFWSPRRELSGTYDREWERNRLPLLPKDWRVESLLCAPADQRPVTHLRGGELVELSNLTPSGKLIFVIPRVHLAFTTRIGRRDEEHRGSLATIIIEPDPGRVMLVWASSLTCRTDVDYLERTIVREKRFVR